MSLLLHDWLNNQSFFLKAIKNGIPNHHISIPEIEKQRDNMYQLHQVAEHNHYFKKYIQRKICGNRGRIFLNKMKCF